MLYQIICLSCGYRCAWPTLLEAQADGYRHHVEHQATAARPAQPREDTDGGDGSGPNP